eukprot:9476112-Pyramimonas_sp.AAC.2
MIAMPIDTDSIIIEQQNARKEASSERTKMQGAKWRDICGGLGRFCTQTESVHQVDEHETAAQKPKTGWVEGEEAEAEAAST